MGKELSSAPACLPMTILTHQLCPPCCLGMIVTATFRSFGLFWMLNLSTTGSFSRFEIADYCRLRYGNVRLLYCNFGPGTVSIVLVPRSLRCCSLSSTRHIAHGASLHHHHLSIASWHPHRNGETYRRGSSCDPL
jgi:hypothetical protein